MSTNKDITLYLDNRNPPPVVPVSQGDTDWLYRFTVMNNNAVYAPTVNYVILTGHKPDGHVFAYRGAKSGNLYTVTPASANGNLAQMTAVPGDVPCELRLISSNRSVGTLNFILRVEPGPEGVVTVASASALPAYTTILQELGVLIGKVETLPDDVPGWIGDWLEAHISGGQGVAVDNTLTVQGAAADAKAAGDRLTALEGGKLSIDGSDELTDSQKAAIRNAISAETAGAGLSVPVKTALLDCFAHVAWVNNLGQRYYDTLYNALYPDSPVPSGWSGMDRWIDGVAYHDLDIVNNEYVESSTGMIKTYSGWNRTGYVNCEGASYIAFAAFNPSSSSTATISSCWFFDANKQPVSKISIPMQSPVNINVPSNAKYFALSESATGLANYLEREDGIVPYA